MEFNAFSLRNSNLDVNGKIARQLGQLVKGQQTTFYNRLRSIYC